jgi:hypothetical protein
MGDKDGDPRIKSGNDDEGGRTGRSVRFGRRVEPPVSFPAAASAEGKGIHPHAHAMDPPPSPSAWPEDDIPGPDTGTELPMVR